MTVSVGESAILPLPSLFFFVGYAHDSGLTSVFLFAGAIGTDPSPPPALEVLALVRVQVIPPKGA